MADRSRHETLPARREAVPGPGRRDPLSPRGGRSPRLGPGLVPDALQARLPEVEALVMAPWLPWRDVLDLPVFDEARLRRAPNLEVIAGTFDFRLEWIDLDAAARHGVTVVDTSRTMT
jgi:hypothetical protein